MNICPRENEALSYSPFSRLGTRPCRLFVAFSVAVKFASGTGFAIPCSVVSAVRVGVPSPSTLDLSPAKVKALVYTHSTKRLTICGSLSGRYISTFWFVSAGLRNLAPITGTL